MKKAAILFILLIAIVSSFTFFTGSYSVLSTNLFETNIEKSRSFFVEKGFKTIGTFHTFNDALNFARGQDGSKIMYGKDKVLVWENKTPDKQAILMDAAHIMQMPELPRGCEVTSLTMLLQSSGVDVDKLTLAKEIKKDPTPYTEKDGRAFFGNPNFGFVGDMHSYDNPGLGVYHGPIRMLAEKYLPNEVIDLTGVPFKDLEYFLAQGHPIWVITNTRYEKLPESEFHYWSTPIGTVKITYREHSVLLTGFDDSYIYFNDPLSEGKNRKVVKESFQEAYEQMGSQAIMTITDEKPKVIR